MTISNTLTVEGVTYAITLDGGSYTDNVFHISSGDAASGVTLANSSQLNIANDALSYQDTVSGEAAYINISAGGVSYQDSLTGAGILNDYGNVWYVSATKGGGLYAYSGSTVHSGQFGVGSVEYVMAGAADYDSFINEGYQGVTGTATGVTVENQGEQVTENGGIAYNTVDESRGDLQGWSGGTFVNFQIQAGGIAILYAGSAFDGGTVAGTLDVNAGVTGKGTVTIEGGIINLASGSTIKGEIEFGGGVGTLTNSGTHNLTLAGFTSGDEIFLSGTSLPKSKHVTLNSKGVLTIGSIKETFVHGAGMVLNLTSTSSGVEITEKKSPAEASTVSSCSARIFESTAKASPEIAASLWSNPKMDFIGTALTDEPLGETHLGKTSFAARLGDDLKVADIIGLRGAASSELTLTYPTISAGAQVTTLPLQNSILSIATFGLG